MVKCKEDGIGRDERRNKQKNVTMRDCQKDMTRYRDIEWEGGERVVAGSITVLSVCEKLKKRNESR